MVKQKLEVYNIFDEFAWYTNTPETAKKKIREELSNGWRVVTMNIINRLEEGKTKFFEVWVVYEKDCNSSPQIK